MDKLEQRNYAQEFRDALRNDPRRLSSASSSLTPVEAFRSRMKVTEATTFDFSTSGESDSSPDSSEEGSASSEERGEGASAACRSSR